MIPDGIVAALLISGREWLWPGLVLLGVATAALLWGYARSPAPPGLRAACLTLKILGLLALFACLLEPLWSGQRARPGANYLAIIADNSQGMTIKDAGEGRTRGELLRETLTTDQTDWQGKLEENFQVRRYAFDSRLQAVKNFGELGFDGRLSSLGGALRTLGDRYRGQPLAGVVLFTDGNATDMTEGVTQLSGLPPIYPVIVGSDKPIKDIAIQKVAVTQTAFEDAPVSIQADVITAGFAGTEVQARLMEVDDRDASAKQVGEQALKAVRDGEVMAFRFQIKPEKSGIRFYRVQVAAKGEMDQFERPEAATEATLANNSRVIVVDRGKGPYRVLYVSGRPNWEYKFLRRALEDDDQVQLSALIRIAKREPKMDFRGRAGESSNPLYRGFGNQSKEEVERYDQPVIRPIPPTGDRDEFDRLVAWEGFPKTPDQLYRYHAIILDDVESEFFTRDQMALIQKFVSERGGGFLMLGGQESFNEGGYDKSPIGQILPVYLDKPTEQKPGSPFRLSLTREGWLQPWARLRNNEADERKRLGDTPPFLVMNRVREGKPGATVVATASDGTGKEIPALVVQRFGNGRSAALTVGDMWHWGLRDKEVHRDLDKAWRQLVRWLVTDVPAGVELQVEEKTSDPDQSVILQVRVRDEKFQPLENASVAVLVQPVSGAPTTGGTLPSAPDSAPPPRVSTNAIRITAEAGLAEPGLYQATYVPRATGGYRVEAVVTNSMGMSVGRAEAGWSSDPAADEFRSLKPNRALLEELARRTGGELIEASRLSAFAAGLPQRKAPIAETWSYPLWHQPLVFLFALACFAGEWGLRRWKGMA